MTRRDGRPKATIPSGGLGYSGTGKIELPTEGTGLGYAGETEQENENKESN